MVLPRFKRRFCPTCQSSLALYLASYGYEPVRFLLELRKGSRGSGAQGLAVEVIDQLVKSGDMEPVSTGDVPQVLWS